MIRFCSRGISLTTDPRAGEKRELVGEKPGGSCQGVSTVVSMPRTYSCRACWGAEKRDPHGKPSKTPGGLPCHSCEASGEGLNPSWASRLYTRNGFSDLFSGGLGPIPGECHACPGPPPRGMDKSQCWMVLRSSEPLPAPQLWLSPTSPPSPVV